LVPEPELVPVPPLLESEEKKGLISSFSFSIIFSFSFMILGPIIGLSSKLKVLKILYKS